MRFSLFYAMVIAFGLSASSAAAGVLETPTGGLGLHDPRVPTKPKPKLPRFGAAQTGMPMEHFAGVLQTPTGGFGVTGPRPQPKAKGQRFGDADINFGRPEQQLAGVFGTPTGGWGMDTPPRRPRSSVGLGG